MISDKEATSPGRDPDRYYRAILPAPMCWDVMLGEWGHEKRLNPRNDVMNHSPDGFAWGYGGSGPAQLALAIMVDAVGVKRARRLYQHFKWQRIAPLDGETTWKMTYREVIDWVNDQRLET